MSIGLGYKGACQLRIDEEYTTQQQNGQGYEEIVSKDIVYTLVEVIYKPNQTDVSARGLLKVGKTKYLSALIRSRNQVMILEFTMQSMLLMKHNIRN